MSPDSASAPRLRERLREETARAILAAAEEVFADDGLHGARMERIAARAGVAVGTLYNHFEDRHALVAALTGSRRAALLARIDAALAATSGRPVRVRLAAFLAALGEHAREHGRFLSALVQAGEGPAGSGPPPATLAGELGIRIDALLREAAARGELRPDPEGLFAAAFVGMARAVLVQRLRDGRAFEAAGAELVALFVEGARA